VNMTRSARPFLISIAILSAILLISGLLLFKLVFPQWYFPFFPWLVFTFLFVNSGFLIYFFRFLSQTNQQFIRGFMVSTAVKLLIYFLLILVYVLTSPGLAIPFAVTMSILYIAYTGFDLFVMLSMLKRRRK